MRPATLLIFLLLTCLIAGVASFPSRPVIVHNAQIIAMDSADSVFGAMGMPHQGHKFHCCGLVKLP